MTIDDAAFRNDAGFVEFPITVDPETDSHLRLHFRNHVLYLNRVYLAQTDSARWCPEEFERIFNEFRILYRYEAFSPVEAHLKPEWIS